MITVTRQDSGLSYSAGIKKILRSSLLHIQVMPFLSYNMMVSHYFQEKYDSLILGIDEQHRTATIN